MTTFFRLELRLQETDPPIWRRFALHADARVGDLHRAVRDLGWDGFAGWELMTTDGRFLAGSDPEAPDEEDNGDRRRLSDLLRRTDDRLIYVYDLQDRFAHDIVHEGMMVGPATAWRFLFDGARNFPPEGCGGIDVHRRLVAALKSDLADDEESLVAAFGDWHPDHFDLRRERERWDRDLTDLMPDDPEAEMMAEVMEIFARSEATYNRALEVQSLFKELAAGIAEPQRRDAFWTLIGLVSGRDDMGFDLADEDSDAPRLILRSRDDESLLEIDPLDRSGLLFSASRAWIERVSLAPGDLQAALLDAGLEADALRSAAEPGVLILLPEKAPGGLAILLETVARIDRSKSGCAGVG